LEVLADHGNPIEPVQQVARAEIGLAGTLEKISSALYSRSIATESLFLNWYDCQPSAPESSAATNLSEDCFLKHLSLAGIIP
jgi:hypothetical protein